MSRESNLAKSTIILSIGTFLPQLASFVTLPILTGYLTKEEYGTYDLVSVLVSLLLPAATLEIQNAAFRFLIDVRGDDKEIKKIISTIIAFVIPTSLIPLIVFYFVLPGQPSVVRIFICLYFLSDIAVHCARQICRGLSKTLDYSISSIISAATRVVFVLVCIYWLKTGLLGTIVSLFVSSTVSLIYTVMRVKVYRYVDFRCVDKQKLKEMLKYSWPMIPSSLSAWVMRVSDRFVVTAVLGVAVNAVYSVACKLPSLLTLAQSTFTMAWQENAAIVSKDDDASEYYSSMFRTLFDLFAGCLCGLLGVTPILFRLLIRGDYSQAYPHIPILFAAIFFLCLSTYLGGIFFAFKKSASVGLTTVAAAIINIVVDLGLIWFIGLYAASISTLVSYFFLFVFRVVSVQKLIKVRYDIRHMAVVFGLITVSCVVFVFRNIYLDIANLAFGAAVFLILNMTFVKTVLKKLSGLLKKNKKS